MPSRRQVLKRSATLAAASVAGLSGCLGFVGSSGAGTSVEEWLVDPAVLADDRGGYTLSAIDMSAFAAQSDTLPREQWGRFRDARLDEFDFTRLFAEDVDLLLDVAGGWQVSNGYSVVVTEVDTDILDSNLVGEGFQTAGEHRGYQLYEHEQQGSVVAVSGDALVPVTDTREGEPLVLAERVLDAQAGDERRYTETVPEFETLADETTAGDVFSAFVGPDSPVEETNVEDGQFRNMIGSGLSLALGSETTEVELVLVFLNRGDPDRRDIEDWTRESDSLDRVRDIGVEVDGQTATVSGELPTREVFESGSLTGVGSEGSSDADRSGPQVSFDYDYDESAGELTVKVESGDTFTAEQVRFDGRNIGGFAGAKWHQVAIDERVTADSTVGAGDRARASGLPPDFELDVVWTSEDGYDSSVLSTRSGPEA